MYQLRKEMKIVTVYNVILQIFWWAVLCESTKQSSIEDMIALKKEPVTNLRCLVCHSEKDGRCSNITESGEEIKDFDQMCDTNITMCMVRRFSFTSNFGGTMQEMKTFAVKRNCSANCEPGCVIMGERTRLYVCNSCCQSDSCNIGSGSEVFGSKASWVLFLFIPPISSLLASLAIF